MKTLLLVQSNIGKGHHARVDAFADYINDKLVITKPFTGDGKDTEFFDMHNNDIFLQYLEYNPDVIITEGFPFGRHGWHPRFNPKMKHGGIVDILQNAKEQSKKIYSLERDIPYVHPKDSSFHAEILNEYYNSVIFHTDNSFIDPKQFFHNPIIDVPFISTNGYVTKPFDYNTNRNGVLVSSGDWYPQTEHIYNTAIELKKRIGGTWTFIIGDKTSNEMIDKLKKEKVNIVSRPDVNGYRVLLASHEVSISQFGAMSFIDINITKTPAVMIPNPLPKANTSIYDEEGNEINQEEWFRAERYSRFGGGIILNYETICADTMNGCIDLCRTLKPKKLNMNGSEFVKTLFNNGESDV
jgi:predicted glycosyltransferase